MPDTWAGAPPSPRFESDKEDGEDLREPISLEMFSPTNPFDHLQVFSGLSWRLQLAVAVLMLCRSADFQNLILDQAL